MCNDTNFGDCGKFLLLHVRVIKCDYCFKRFHVKCCITNHKNINFMKKLNCLWHSEECIKDNLERNQNTILKNEITDLPAVRKSSNTKPKSTNSHSTPQD